MKKQQFKKRITALVMTFALFLSLTITTLAAEKQIDPYEKYLTIKDIFKTMKSMFLQQVIC
jgi:hypothetical protein